MSKKTEKPEYYQQDVKNVLELLKTSKNGLSHQASLDRLSKFGLNELQIAKETPLYLKILAQFKDLMILLLIASGALAFILGDFRTGGILLAIVLVNAYISYSQESKAEKIMNSLQNYMVEKAKVLRDGKLEEINAKELAVGDVIYIEEGDAVPADCRIIEEEELSTNDFALTGESNPARKFTHAIKKNTVIGGRGNLVFMGTTVATGNAYGVVIATGMYTELGRIANLSQNTNSGLSPLQRELNNLAYKLTVATLILAVLLTIIALGADLSVKEAILFAIGIASAMIPQGLPAEINVSLAEAARKLASDRALVKKLSAVETLGSTNIICTDKTGTLTKNQMTVEHIFMLGQQINISGTGYRPEGMLALDDGQALNRSTNIMTNFMLTGASFASNAHIEPPDDEHGDWYCIGDPTEGAIITLAEKAGINTIENNQKYKELKEFPFDSSRKMMSSIRVYDDNLTAFLKGAPEEILAKCVSIIDTDGKIKPLSDKQKKIILGINEQTAKKAYRNIAVAYKYLDSATDYKQHNPESVEHNLIYLGMLCMVDPVREEVPEAMVSATKAHIKINIITGDYATTAKAVALRANLATKSEDIILVSGEQIEEMSDEDLLQYAKKGSVIFSRVSPGDKLRIVSLLESDKNVVAVTGDGVNDAPALKQANIGVAMGVTGTDVAKQASEIVLLDDSFHTLVGAVKNGRVVFQNIKKATISCLTSNFGELITVLFGLVALTLAGIPPAITPVLILAIDLLAELFPIAALGWDKAEKDLMAKKPRNLNNHIYNTRVFFDLLFSGIVLGILAFGNYILFVNRNGGFGVLDQSSEIYLSAITLTYVTIVLCQFANIFIRRAEGPTLSKYIFSNKHLLISMSLTFILVLSIVYLPPVQFIFGSGSLNLIDWGYAVLASIIFFVIRESAKLINLQLNKRQQVI